MTANLLYSTAYTWNLHQNHQIEFGELTQNFSLIGQLLFFIIFKGPPLCFKIMSSLIYSTKGVGDSINDEKWKLINLAKSLWVLFKFNFETLVEVSDVCSEKQPIWSHLRFPEELTNNPFHHSTHQCVFYKLKKFKMDMRFENNFEKFKCF